MTPDLQSALDVFRRGPAILQEALSGASESETTFVTAPGKWTIRQIVRHVADTEIVVGMRLRQIVAEGSPADAPPGTKQPILIPFDQEAWADNLGYAAADPFESFERFRSFREDTTALLESLPAATFERIGLHPERGAKTLLEWVRIFGAHVERHADQIRGIRVAAAK